MRKPALAAALLFVLSSGVMKAATPAAQSKANGIATVCVDANGAFVYCRDAGTSSLVLTESAPNGGNVAITTSAATAIPAAARLRWSYQAQGTGHACASWVTTAVTIAVSAADVVTCGGAGAFALSPGSLFSSQLGATPTTPLTVIGAAPAGGILALNLAWDAQ